MKTEQLVFSLIQITHNLGGALAVGAPLFWLFYKPNDSKLQGTLWLMAALFTLQGITGGLFFLASIKIYGAWPEFTTIALYAIYFKIALVVVGLHLSVLLLLKNNGTISKNFWILFSTLSVAAITTAGILRWNM